MIKIDKTLMISVVIPNFNGEKLLRKNLPKVLHAKAHKPNKVREIVIVDDGSKDKSVQLLKTKFPSVRIIKHKKNFGFSVAVNTGVKHAKSDLVCLLNTDVIPNEKFLVGITRYFNNKRTFAVSLHEKGYGYASGEFVKGFIVHHSGKERSKPTETFWVSGGSGVFRRSTWIQLNGLDEKLFSPFYWEDVDISYRALKRGYKIYWIPDAKVIHKHESTVGKSPISQKRKDIIVERNQLLFLWKNITSRKLFKKHILGLLKRLVLHPGYIQVVFAAILKANYLITLKKREQKESLLTDEEVLRTFQEVKSPNKHKIK